MAYFSDRHFWHGGYDKAYITVAMVLAAGKEGTPDGSTPLPRLADK